MAKGQQNQATDVATKMTQQVPGDVAPVVNNANQQQQQLQTGASSSLGTAQGFAQGAGDTYTDFAKTGGFTPTDETTFLNRATRGVAGTYDVLKQAADRRRAAAGGLGTGGEDVALARHAAQDVASANTDAEAQLKSQENANKLSGAGGLSSLYGTAANLYVNQEGLATQEGKQILDSLGLKYSTDAEAGQILASLSKNPGAFDNILRTVTAVSGLVTPKSK